MATADFTLEFNVYCNECGEALECATNVDSHRGRVSYALCVDPCVACLESTRAKSYDEGQDDGRAEASEDE